MSKKRPCKKTRHKQRIRRMQQLAILENNLRSELGDTPRKTEMRTATQRVNRGLSAGIQQSPYYHQLTLVKKD